MRALTAIGPKLAQQETGQGWAGRAQKPLFGTAGRTSPAPQHLRGILAEGAAQLSGKHLTTVHS